MEKSMIIASLLDTDLYKFTMMQVVLHHFPGAQVEYRFKCRNEGVDLVPLIDDIQREIEALCSLRFTDEELDYLRQFRFLKSDFIDFLGLFQMNRKYISVAPAPQGNGEIDIVIKGPWLHTILCGIPVLAIVNELYFRRLAPNPDYDEGRRRLDEKIATIVDDPEMEGIRIADYGTRRRFSARWQEEVLQVCKERLGDVLTGTSNVMLAMRYGRMSTCRPARRWGRGCVIRRSSPSRLGRASTAATWASRCRTCTGWMRSCATSTCTSASSSTAHGTIRAIRSSGASA